MPFSTAHSPACPLCTPRLRGTTVSRRGPSRPRSGTKPWEVPDQSRTGNSSARGTSSQRQPAQQKSAAGLSGGERAVLDQYWKLRGVTDSTQREELITVVERARKGLLGGPEADLRRDVTGAFAGSCYQDAYAAGPAPAADAPVQLPGLSATWMSTAERENVARFSERLLALEAAFGGEGSVDVAWMVVREPRISQVEPSSVMQRLYEMKMAQGGSITDILAAVESQPGLLLEGASPDASEAAEGQVAAWREGQATDNDTEWGRRYAQLLDYGREHGDVHVGFRDDDDEGLARWAATQRRALSRGALDAARRQQLEDAGFEFSEEAAEWMRWYSYVREASLESPEDTGLSSMLSDVGKSENYYAQNWQAVQRVARRNGRLSQERIELLDEIRFDWTGADPLS